MSRVERFRTSSFSFSLSDIQSQVYSTHDGAYIIELSYGTPPVSQIGIIDTGSDLIWTQCQPCFDCYKQYFPIFNPSESLTYKTQSCDSDACRSLGTKHTSCKENVCNYYYGYGDKSYTSGDIAIETITFKSDNNNSRSLANITFACGHENVGTFPYQSTGLVGLGGGPLSLVSQLGSSIKGKFSYCLIPFFKEGNFTSKISFGTNEQVSGDADGVISTPLIPSSPFTFYYLTLNGVTIGKTTIPFNRNGRTVGNIIIDSGTTVTYLPLDMYSSLSSVLEEAIQGQKVDDKSGNNFKLCYKTSRDGADLNIPYVTAHFDGGDLVLTPINTFVAVADDIACLAIMPSNLSIGAIFGNIAQIDFLVGYDTYGGMVSFMPTDCTNH
ncbi:aspartic proteinase CDR1-like [Silene latifolia]|uniref:aspartic proteinase CDR1-like n=1 Tax=Silene latifolia TaxID=37657 RepID=UPI003D7802FE